MFLLGYGVTLDLKHIPVLHIRPRGKPEQPGVTEAFRGIIVFYDLPQHPELPGPDYGDRPVGLQDRHRHPARFFRTLERCRTVDRSGHPGCDRRQHGEYRIWLRGRRRLRLFERCRARRARPPRHSVSATPADDRAVARLVQRGSGKPQLHHPGTSRGHYGAGRGATYLAHHLTGVGTGNHGAIGLHTGHAK